MDADAIVTHAAGATSKAKYELDCLKSSKMTLRKLAHNFDLRNILLLFGSPLRIVQLPLTESAMNYGPSFRSTLFIDIHKQAPLM